MLLQTLKNAFSRKRSPSELNALALERHGQGDWAQAEQLFREVALATGDFNAWKNLAATQIAQQKHAAAVPALEELIALQPGFAEAHFELGTCRNRLKENADAIVHFRRAIALKPSLTVAHAGLINAYLDSCEWDAAERWAEDLRRQRRAHPGDWADRIEPFSALTVLPVDLCRAVAVHRASQVERSVQGKPALPARPSKSDGKIRLGYVSADFYSHAVANLTFGLYEAHDRSAFEVFAYSIGPDDGSVYRKHIEASCDRFIDVRAETPDATARRIREDGIDILLDMNVYTVNGRPAIFAQRPAPIQVNYLGYPGTSGSKAIDYYLSDPVATPTGLESEFTERIVRLPDCYQPNDRRHTISSAPLARSDVGLPDDAFVFCSFNTLRKVDRQVFTAWMDILIAVPGSVLWLLEGDPLAQENLRKQAAKRGVEAGRVVFAPKAPKDEHLARHRLADLFLDTFAYNSHTGASDSLWAGLPLLTCPGQTFASRVGASIVSAAGLHELIASDAADYRGKAIDLARHPQTLADLRAKLAANRLRCALFDTGRYVKNLEAAYQRMVALHREGRAPESFAV